MSSQLSVGEVITFQKPHQCGGFAREILQLSRHFGTIRCLTCGKISKKYIPDIKRNIRNANFGVQASEIPQKVLKGNLSTQKVEIGVPKNAITRLDSYDNDQPKDTPLVPTSESSTNAKACLSCTANIKTDSAKMDRINDFFFEGSFRIFREFCVSNKLVYMKDLCGFDFDKLIRVSGIGVGKVSQIKARWREYAKNVDSTPSTTSTPMERIDHFFAERCFKIFREFCSRSKLVHMKDLHGFDFDKLIGVRGIGIGKVGQIKARWSDYTKNVDPKSFDLEKGMPISRRIVDVSRRAIAEVIGAEIVERVAKDMAKYDHNEMLSLIEDARACLVEKSNKSTWELLKDTMIEIATTLSGDDQIVPYLRMNLCSGMSIEEASNTIVKLVAKFSISKKLYSQIQVSGENVHQDNLDLPVSVLRSFGLNIEVFPWLNEKEMTSIHNLFELDLPTIFRFEDFEIRHMQEVLRSLDVLNTSIPEQFFYCFRALFMHDERACGIILNRAEGNTLEQVGRCYDITRERVRQIESKVLKKFRRYITRFIDFLATHATRGFLSLYDLKDVFTEKEEAQVFYYCLKNTKTERISYLKSLDLIVIDMKQGHIQEKVVGLNDKNTISTNSGSLQGFAKLNGLLDIEEVDNATSNSQADSKSNCFDTSLSHIIDLGEGKVGLRKILSAHFQTLHGYSNINILWSAAQSSLPMFLNDNAINSPEALWDLLSQAFEGEFVFFAPHIWQKKPDYPQNSIGIVINLARQQKGIATREQIDNYFSRIKINAPINSNILKQELVLFYENRRFILAETVDLSQERCDAVTRALDKLFTLENVAYIVLRDITVEWFSHLPEIRGGIPWTALLLQEVLRVCPKIGYRVIFSGLDGQSLDTLGAAIVPDKSDVKTFADVVHRFCYEKCALPIKMPTEKLRITLREAGMLDGNELIYNLHKSLKDHRFGFTDENRTVKILER